MRQNPLETADLVTFTEEILNGKPLGYSGIFYTSILGYFTQRKRCRSLVCMGINENIDMTWINITAVN